MFPVGEMDGNYQSYESRLEELRNRLQSTERQNQARAVELHHLQQQLRRVAEVTGNSSYLRGKQTKEKKFRCILMVPK